MADDVVVFDNSPGDVDVVNVLGVDVKDESTTDEVRSELAAVGTVLLNSDVEGVPDRGDPATVLEVADVVTRVPLLHVGVKVVRRGIIDCVANDGILSPT